MSLSPDEMLHSVIDSMPHGVVLIDDNQRIIDINASAYRLLHVHTDTNVPGLPFQQFIRLADGGETDSASLLTPHDQPRESVLVNQLGRSFAALHWAGALSLSNNEVLLFTFMDISELRAVEAQTRQLALFAELNPHPELRIDAAGVVWMANPAAIQAFGPAIEGAKYTDFIPQAQDLDLRWIIANGKLQALSRVIDGQHYGFMFRGVPELKIAHIYCMEITDHVLAEQAAQQEYAKLSAMISNMEEGVLFADGTDTVVEANAYFCRFMSVDRSELVGHSILDVTARLVPDIAARIAEMIERYRAHDAAAQAIALQLQHGDAEVIHRIQPIFRNQAYDGVLLNIVNVTELVVARKQAESANQAKSQFLANMSHELKTPLTVINGFAEVLLEKGFGDLNDVQERYLHQIYNNGLQLLAIVSDLLDLARIESGRMELQLCEQDIAVLCREAKSAISSRLSTNVEIVYEMPAEPVSCEVDALRIKQVLVNLLTNAAKFTEQGRITVWLEDAGANARFGVRDTGAGIEQHHLPNLFRAFEQAQDKYAAHSKGTGLGLALCREIVQAHHGTIEVESEAGHGSNFIVTLPKKQHSD